MPDIKALLREAAIEGISGMAQHLPEGCELFVIACRPGKDDFDLVLPSPEANLNNALDALRRQGLSIDGSNIYKDAVCDLIVGALAMGKQNNNPPPAGHWGQQFWDIGRAEGELQEELASALVKVTADLFYQIEAKHGPKAAAEYPSIVEAKALIAKATA
ncbi:hypothetical protein K8374_13200 [Pseudomonas sp. p1(2021b)]|uniref:hypothetical protein n=1 Tax=Pseudomonas sp. p1(2021b) TaxID=2874628 RepID=UPI001CCCF58B|nr:hypothetical protein [Pseudomonas sp. p1(2021b)]UBM23359.1 hypothetical protein K8374_13200 [Pseudomonas sp. p1(2021b)]